MPTPRHTGVQPHRRILIWQAGLYAATGLALWPVPVFQVLHVESAALVAAVSFFCAGIGSIALLERGIALRSVLTWQLSLLTVPWLLLTLTLFWAPNAGYALGLLFWFLFPPVSTVLAVAVAWALTGTNLPFRRLLLVTIGLTVALLGVVYDIGFHPQFYTYNAVFGGILGPIYDEELTITHGLFAARAVTLLWAAFLVWIGFRLRETRGRWVSSANGAIMAALLVLAHVFAPQLGINTTPERIQSALGTALWTEHFEIHVDGSRPNDPDLGLLAAAHEYRLEQLHDRTGLAVAGRIKSYVYPDAEARARLTGARETSVAPIWLKEPQTHLLLANADRAMAHELAHVLSREIGLPVLRISPSVGLLEGWAEALEPPDGFPDVHEQVAAGLLMAGSLGLPGSAQLVSTLTRSFSSLRFWTGRSAVSYTTMGSFVRFLLNRYGIGPFGLVYRGGSWSAAYGKPVEALTREWLMFLADVDVDPRTTEWVRVRFARPSLFERPSPHTIPRHVRLLRRGRDRLAEGDTLATLQHWERGLEIAPNSVELLDQWTRLVIAANRPDLAVRRLHPLVNRLTSPILWIRYGDALLLQEMPHAASVAYRHAAGLIAPFDRVLEARLSMRMILLRDPGLLALRYAGRLPEGLPERSDLDLETELVRMLEWGLVLYEHHHVAEAVAAWPECGRISSMQVAAFCHVKGGEMALVEGDYDRAISAYSKATEIYSELRDRHYALFLADRAQFARQLKAWGGPDSVLRVHRP